MVVQYTLGLTQTAQSVLQRGYGPLVSQPEERLLPLALGWLCCYCHSRSPSLQYPIINLILIIAGISVPV